MTCSPVTDVGPPPRSARLPTRRWDNTNPNVLRGESQSLSAGRNCRRALAILGALALASLCRSRRRLPIPAMHRLVVAEEQRFAELCHQLTHARLRGAQK